jgi:hypothetical protein
MILDGPRRFTPLCSTRVLPALVRNLSGDIKLEATCKVALQFRRIGIKRRWCFGKQPSPLP